MSTLTRYILAYDENFSDNITMETTHMLCEAEDSSVELQVSTCEVHQLYTQSLARKVLSQEATPHACGYSISHIHVVYCIVRNLSDIWHVMNDNGQCIRSVHGLHQFIIIGQSLRSNVFKKSLT